MYSTAREFTDDPCSAMKRGAMVRAARALLSAVTRLLILADMVDVYLLLNSLQLVSMPRHRPNAPCCFQFGQGAIAPSLSATCHLHASFFDATVNLHPCSVPSPV